MRTPDTDYVRSNISSKYSRKRLGSDVNVEIGYVKRIKSEVIKKQKYIEASWISAGTLFQKDIIDQMLEICPDDFEPVAVTLTNWHKESEPFKIEDFYAINVLQVIKAVDETKSVIDWSENGIPYIHKLCYKEDPWQDGCDTLYGPSAPKDTNRYPPKKLDKPCMIAIDALSGAVVWHPKLAAILPPNPYIFCAQDFETNMYI